MSSSQGRCSALVAGCGASQINLLLSPLFVHLTVWNKVSCARKQHNAKEVSIKPQTLGLFALQFKFFSVTRGSHTLHHDFTVMCKGPKQRITYQRY